MKKQTHSFVVGVHKNDFVVFVDAILVNPVRVQNSQIATSLAHPLLSSTPQTALEFKLVYTMMHGLAVSRTYLSFIQKNQEGGQYRCSYPWGRASCGYHDGLGHDR
jgi:hypothetical protein